MDISFTPSPDVAVVLNTLLDKFENHAHRNTQSATRPIKTSLSELLLPFYFSQTDPIPRILSNEQFKTIERAGLLRLNWIPGETGHLLDAVVLQIEHATQIYSLLHRSALADSRDRLETLLLGDQFRFSGSDDWRFRAVRHIVSQLRAEKSSSPFSLTDAGWNNDLLTLLTALPTLITETPYRVFSVRIFNDSKRFDELKPALLRLALHGNPQWKSLPGEELLRELNLVANPSYIHLSGNWQFIPESGEVISLSSFIPSIGFPAVQATSIRAVAIHADAVLCIENLTTFHEFIRSQESWPKERPMPPYAILCTLGNPSPAVRHILGLIPGPTPIYLWSDLDYGGFNILSQLRRQVTPCVQPYRMDIADFEAHAHFSRPLTLNDERNLKHLLSRLELKDVYPAIDHLLKRGLKLEQEALVPVSPSHAEPR